MFVSAQFRNVVAGNSSLRHGGVGPYVYYNKRQFDSCVRRLIEQACRAFCMSNYSRRVVASAAWVFVALIAVPQGRCDDTKLSEMITGERWPEADILFHRDPSWLGGDDAYSLDLGDGRVAWFFGDSFVAPVTPGERRGTTMVHNSVGIQTGYDPLQADFKAYWRTKNGKHISFFPDDGKHYFWPGGSIRIDGKLLVFFMQSWTKDPSHAMGFQVDGWAATLVDNIDESPDRWELQRLEAPQNDFGVLVGSASLVRDGDHLVAFSVGGAKHEVYLVRWRWDDASAGDLGQPEWWAGAERGWVSQSELRELPGPVFEKGQTEFTVDRLPQLDRYVQFQFTDFPVSPIGVRSAAALTGPWSTLEACVRPEVLMPSTPGLMLYAAKAHPEQKCDGLALTYASNTHKLEQLLDSSTIYYPQFVRVKLIPEAD
jgi:hypothetical protein